MNGHSLIELSIARLNRNSKPYIAQFCPNLKIFFTILECYELYTLKTMFDGCQYLESIKVWCGDSYLNDIEMLKIVTKYAPKSFCSLKVDYNSPSNLLPEDLESFFMDWGNRPSQ